MTSQDGEALRKYANNFPFNQADALWKSFQKKINDFVINPFLWHSSILEFIRDEFFNNNLFLIISSLSLLFIFLPFQLIKDYYFKKNVSLSFLKKTGILTIIVSLVIIVFGLFSNIWQITWYENFWYLVYAFGFALIFTALLYLMIDRYVEKRTLKFENGLNKA